MTYSAGEALVLTVLQSASGFSAANTSRGKWGIRNKGTAAFYGIIRPGPFMRDNNSVGGKIVQTNWTTVIEVWQRYKEEGTSLTDLEANVAAVIAVFDPKRKLGDTTNTVQDAMITSGADVMEIGEPGQGPNWLKQEVSVVWKEETSVTLAE